CAGQRSAGWRGCAKPPDERSRSTDSGPPPSAQPQILVAVVFAAAEGAALVPVGDAVGRDLRLAGKGGVAKVLGAAARAIAEAERVPSVPPAARIVGGAEEDFAADIGVLEADADELREILRRYPDREPTQVDRLVGEIADADRGHAQAVLRG